MPLEKRWTFHGEGYISPRIDSSPAIADGAVYVGVSEYSVFSPKGRIVSLELSTGKPRWEQKTRLPVFSSPAVSGGRVFVGEGYHQDRESRLWCLDADTGRMLWSFEAKSHVESSPQMADGRVYFGAGEDGLYCLDAKDGRSIWHFEKQHVDISPWVSSDFVYAGTGYGDLGAFCLSKINGSVLWMTPAGLPVWGSPLLLENRLYYGLGNGNFLQSATDPKGGVICLNARTGKELWRKNFPDAVLTAISYRRGKIFFGCRDGNLYAASAAGGMILWNCTVGGPVVASPAVGQQRVVAVSVTGKLVIASIDTGEQLENIDLSHLLGKETGVVSSPALSAGRIFIGTTTGEMICLGGKK